MAKIGYKRGVSNLISYIDVMQFKTGYMMLENPEQLCFEAINLHTPFHEWEKGRLFNADNEVKWLKRRDGFHLVIITETKLPAGFDIFHENLCRVTDEAGNFRPDQTVYRWGEKEFDGNQPLSQWYEGRIPEVLKYPFDGTQDRNLRRVCVRVREYELTKHDPDGRPFTSIIHRYVRLEERR